METKQALRDFEVIVAQHDAVTAYEQRASSLEFRNFLLGARAALEWVLGRATLTPASRVPRSVTVGRMVREEQYCDQLIYAPAPRPVLDPDYANGVEHALAWARGAETVPPAPLETSADEDRPVCTCG